MSDHEIFVIPEGRSAEFMEVAMAGYAEALGWVLSPDGNAWLRTDPCDHGQDHDYEGWGSPDWVCPSCAGKGWVVDAETMPLCVTHRSPTLIGQGTEVGCVFGWYADASGDCEWTDVAVIPLEER